MLIRQILLGVFLLVYVVKVDVSSGFVFIGLNSTAFSYILSPLDSPECFLLPSLILFFTIVPSQGCHCQETILHEAPTFMHVLQAEALTAFVLGYLSKLFILKNS